MTVILISLKSVRKMASCRSDVAAQIKQALTMQEVAERYGFTPNRNGYIQCPFHQGDDHGSLKIYPGERGWCCFGCHKGGTAIDFAMLLFDITFPQAVVRLSTDFNLGLSNDTTTPQERSELIEARRREAEKKAEIAAQYPVVAGEYRDCFEIAKYAPPVLLPDGGVWFHPLYAEAVQRMPQLEWWLNENMGR